MTSRGALRRFYYDGRVPDAGVSAGPGDRADAPIAPVIALSPEESRHLLLVLRLGPGDPVEVFDAGGRGFLAEVAASSERGVARLRIAREIPGATTSEPEAAGETGEGPANASLAVPAPAVNLAVAMLKRRAMDLMIEKLSELGVGAFQPLLTRRCIALGDVRPGEAPPDRWDRLAIAAAKQCRRNRPLRALAPLKLRDWLAQPGGHGEDGGRGGDDENGENAGRAGGLWRDAAFGHLAPAAPTLGTWLRETQASRALEARPGGLAAAPIWFAIGPEGGWAEDEIAALTQAGFAPVNLGGLTLRAETAAIAVAAACRLL